MVATALGRPGKKQGGGDLDLFLIKFVGDVLNAYRRKSVTEGRHRTRTITEGKSGQFIVTGRLNGRRHVAGHDVMEDSNSGTGYLQNPQTTEIIVPIDRPIISPVFIDDLDDAMSQYDQNSEYVAQASEFLARTIDKQRLIMIAKGAAQVTGRLTELPGGSSITEANFGVTAEATVDAFFDMKTLYDDKENPEEGRLAYVPWSLYNFLLKEAASDVIDLDITGGTPNGSVATGKIKQLAGFQLIPTTNLPNSNISADPVGPGAQNDYTGDFTNLKALFAMYGSVGTVDLARMGMSFDMEHLTTYRGTLLMSAKTCGVQTLRYEACGRVISA